MNKTKILPIIKNIILIIVIIETIILMNTMSNKIVDNKNKIDNLEKQIIEMKRG